MRTDAPPEEAIVGDLSWRPLIQSWRGTKLLADDIPIEDGNAVYSIDQEVPDTLSLTVPRKALGRVWEPTSPYDPLARYGQQLMVKLRTRTSGKSWVTAIGRYQIQSWDVEDGLIKLSAKGLLQKAVDDELLLAKSPPRAATIRSEILRVVPPGVEVVFHGQLRDRAVPRTMNWGVSRIETLYELAEAWPARLRVDPYGKLHFMPVITGRPYPTLRLTDGENGTIIGAPKSDSRDGIYNRVIIEGTTDDKKKRSFQSVQEIKNGPLAVSTYGAVTYRDAPELVKTPVQAQAMANNLIHQWGRSSYVLPIEMVSDPRVEADLVVAAHTDGEDYLGWINGWDLPLVYRNTMRIDVGVSTE